MKRSSTKIYPKLPFYLLVVLIPLVHLPFINASVFAAPKLLVLRLITFTTLAFISYQVFVSRQFIFRESRFNLLLLGYAAATFLSTIFSEFVYTSLLGIDGRFIGLFTMINFFILAFLAFNTFKKTQELRPILKVSLIVSTLTAVYGIIQDQIWFEELTRNIFQWGISPTLRTFSTFGHSNHFALYLGMHLPIAIYFALTPKNSLHQKLPYYISSLLLIWALFTTGSRGALIATAIAVIGLVFWLMYQSNSRRKKNITIGFFIALLAILAIICFTPLKQTFNEFTVVKRFNETISQVQKGHVTDRQSWWYSSISMWKDAPIFGHGLSTFADTYNRYRRTDYVLQEDYQDITVPHYAHMDYLNLLATQGIIGLLTYLVLILWVFLQVFRYIRNPRIKNEDKILIFTLATAISIYLLNMFVNFGVISTLTFFYLFLGALTGITSKASFHQSKRCIATISITILVFAAVATLYSITQYSADVFKSRAEKSRFSAQEENYERAIWLVPYEFSYYADYADLLVQKAQVSDDIAYSQDNIKRALLLYLKAESINDSHPYLNNHIAIAYKELLKIAADNGDPANYDKYHEAATANYQKAIAKGPNNPRYLYNFAQFEYTSGRYQKAIDLYLQILEIRAPYRNVYNRLQQSYQKLGNQEKADYYGEKTEEQFQDAG